VGEKNGQMVSVKVRGMRKRKEGHVLLLALLDLRRAQTPNDARHQNTLGKCQNHVMLTKPDTTFSAKLASSPSLF